MALKHAKPGEVVNLLCHAENSDPISQALVSEPRMELMRLILEAGKQLPAHAVAGPITLYCHQGSVEVESGDGWQPMHDNDLMYLDGGTGHAVRALTDAIMLVTIFRPAAD